MRATTSGNRGSGRRNGLCDRTKKLTKDKRFAALANSLTKKAPYKETALGGRRTCRRRYGDLRVAGEVCDWGGADPASRATVKRLVNERRIASNIMNCRAI